MSAPRPESVQRAATTGATGKAAGKATGKVTAVGVQSAAKLAAKGPETASSTPATTSTVGRRQRFEARRVRRIIRHIDPWSVLKVSLVFFICVWIMFMVAVVIVWSIAQSSGTVDKIESFVNDLGVTGWKLNSTFVFRQYGLFGLVMVFAGTTASVISAIIFNLISDLVGGVWVSVIEEETSRPVSD